MKRLRCFIAMPFGRTDTDALYRKALVPTLSALSMRALRVDKKEHNDNIDDVIIQGIERAHLVIADLTYARPSVYYEAGYAERKIPVIYTVRADHLDADSEAFRAGKRVHFDLSMKNIIDWKPGALAAFARRLRRRVKHVTREMAREDLKQATLAKEAEAFKARPMEARHAVLRARATAALHERGFRTLTEGGSHTFWKREGAVLFLVLVYVTADIGVSTLHRGESIFDWLFAKQAKRDSALARAVAKVTAVRTRIVFTTTRTFTPLTLDRAFPSANRTSSGAIVSTAERLTVRDATYDKPSKGLPQSRRLYFLDSVSSPSDFAERLKVKLQSDDFGSAGLRTLKKVGR